MARRLRIQYPGARYHVINRGNLPHDLFAPFGATNAFLFVLDEAAVQFGWQVHACVVRRTTTPSPSQHRNRTSCRISRHRTVEAAVSRSRNTGTELRAGDALAAIYVRDAADSIPRSAWPWVSGAVQGPVGRGRPPISPGSAITSLSIPFAPELSPPTAWANSEAAASGTACQRPHAIGSSPPNGCRLSDSKPKAIPDAHTSTLWQTSRQRATTIALGAAPILAVGAIGPAGWRRAIARQAAHLALSPEMSATEIAEIKCARWPQALDAAFREAGKSLADTASAPKGVGWKVAIARTR